MQLEAGELDGQKFDIAIQHIEHRITDVPAQRTGAARCRQHVVDHGGGRGLSVGSGHHQPPLGRPKPAGNIQTPCQFDITPDGQPGMHRGQHDRRGRTEAGTDDHQILIGHVVLRLGGGERPAPRIAMAPQGVLIVVADGNAQVEVGQPRQRRDHGIARDTRTANQNPCSAGQFGHLRNGHGRLVTDRGEPLAVEQRQTQATGNRGQQPEPDDDRRFRPTQ